MVNEQSNKTMIHRNKQQPFKLVEWQWQSKSCSPETLMLQHHGNEDDDHIGCSHVPFKIVVKGFLGNDSRRMSTLPFPGLGSVSSKARLVPINNTLSEKEVSYWLSIMRAAKAGLASSEERETAVDCQARLLFTQATTSISRNAESSTATGITIIFTSAGSSSEKGGL